MEEDGVVWGPWDTMCGMYGMECVVWDMCCGCVVWNVRFGFVVWNGWSVVSDVCYRRVA